MRAQGRGSGQRRLHKGAGSLTEELWEGHSSQLQPQTPTEHPKSHFHGVTLAGSAAAAVPRQGSSRQLRCQPWDVQGDRTPSPGCSPAEGASSAVSYLAPASVPGLRQGVLSCGLSPSAKAHRGARGCSPRFYFKSFQGLVCFGFAQAPRL